MNMTRVVDRGITLLLAALVLAPGAAARAEESQPDSPAPLQAGPVLIRPSLSLKETYSDNVFYTAENTKGDFITSVMPDVKLILPFRLHEVSLGASAEIKRYAEYTSQNVTPYEVFGLGDFSIGDRLKLKVGDTYQHNEESPLDSPNGTSDVYNANAAAASLKYAFVDVAQVRLDYTRTTLDYVDSSYRSRAEDLVSAYLYYRVLPNTSAFLEYDFKNVGYDTSGDMDNNVQTGFVGANWEITEHSKGTAKAGYLAKNYADGSLEDFSTWAASLDLRHHFTDAASVGLLGKRDVNEGKESGMRYYTTTGLFADFTYRFLDRLSGVIEGSYAQEDFSDPEPASGVLRKDKTTHVGIGAKYSFNSWLDFALSYGYTNRDSNIADLDATINTITLRATAYR
jgi:hypothetical protein